MVNNIKPNTSTNNVNYIKPPTYMNTCARVLNSIAIVICLILLLILIAMKMLMLIGDAFAFKKLTESESTPELYYGIIVLLLVMVGFIFNFRLFKQEKLYFNDSMGGFFRHLLYLLLQIIIRFVMPYIILKWLEKLNLDSPIILSLLIYVVISVIFTCLIYAGCFSMTPTSPMIPNPSKHNK